jgi:surface polysaccharide O-acyltransferase-like enzyme
LAPPGGEGVGCPTPYHKTSHAARRSRSARQNNTFCFTALIAGVALFQRKVNSAGTVWSSLAANSYGIYYVHPLILYPLAYVFVAISLSPIVKAPTVIALALLLSWAVSALLLKRLPGLRAIF